MGKKRPGVAVGAGGGRVSPGLGHWEEWRTRCALGLCSPAAQSALRAFGSHHFRRFVRRYAAQAGHRDFQAPLGAVDAWHMLETHMTVRRNRQGKRYKDWLFARAPIGSGRQAALSAGAVVLLRDVAREFLRREGPAPRTVSLQAPAGSSDACGWTLEDLLPGELHPADEAADRELRRLAESHAREFLQNLEQPAWIVLQAHARGIPLSSPAVQHQVGLRKSAVHDLFHQAWRKLSATIRLAYVREDAGVVRLLTLMAVEAVLETLRPRLRKEAAPAGTGAPKGGHE